MAGSQQKQGFASPHLGEDGSAQIRAVTGIPLMHFRCCHGDDKLSINSPGISQRFLDSCDAFRNLSALSAVSCSSRLFLPGGISPPPVSFLITSFSAFLLQVRTRSISLCS